MFKFFKKSAFGLDISDHSTEIIFLGGSIKKPKLLAMGREILKPGIVENGKILQNEKLKNSLKNLIENPQFGQIKTKKFIFSLPESKSFTRVLEAPKVLKRETIEREIELQVAQNFPFTLKDLYFDFKINNKEVLLAAVQKDIINDYLEIFKELKIKPVASEPESLSLARSLIKNQEKIVLIADIGAGSTNLNIFDEKKLRLSVTINTAGDKFTRVLAEKLKLSDPKAESTKKEIGLNPNKGEGEAFLILQKEIQEITSEIKKIDEYFQEKEDRSFEKVILAGGSSALPYLTEYLTENLEIPVVIGDPWDEINIDILKTKEYFKESFKINPILYATAIGSAIRGLTKDPEKSEINLLPKKNT